jgi:molybdopterin molybdotransferase
MSARELVEIEQARRIVLEAVRPLPAAPVELDGALGLVLAEDVVADDPVPGFDNSAMDGFAVRAADLLAARPEAPVTLTVVGESRAGRPSERELGGGQAISISTGAMIPNGADAVVRIEDVRVQDGHLEVGAAPPVGCEVRRAGEDIQAGQRVLAQGTTLGPAELGVLASLGRAEALCSRRPTVSVLVTGDELMTAADAPRAGGVRDTNTHTIPALARGSGAAVSRAALVPDDQELTVAALLAAADSADVIVICGGVSVGEHDHVKPALLSLGAREAFWGIALKPGRPTWFGTLGQTLVFGLPGNPVSAMVTFVMLVRPALRALQGATAPTRRFTAVLDRDYEKPAGRAHALRCRLHAREDGWHAEPTGPQGSHVLTSMLGADVLAIIPTDTTVVRAGDRVEVEALNGFLGALA